MNAELFGFSVGASLAVHCGPKEVLRVWRSDSGKLHAQVEGELYEAAKEFWDACGSLTDSYNAMLHIPQVVRHDH